MRRLSITRAKQANSDFDNPALDFRGDRAEGDDILGDAYEYLMRRTRCATNVENGLISMSMLARSSAPK